MPNRDIVAIGTSAGGVEALQSLTKLLPSTFPAAVLITIHLSGRFRSHLDEILTRSGPLPARFATNGDRIDNSRILIAPPGHHLIVDGERVVLGIGPRENNSRPAIDPMLRSAAVCCGYRTIGVVLTGTMGDGASGLWALNQCGGCSIVQDPADAAFPEMPQNSLNRLTPDHVAQLRDIPRLLERLVQEPAGELVRPPPGLKFEVDVARSGHSSMRDMDRIGRRSVLTCPDCDGVMWEIDEDRLVRFRCHQGHAYTEELMALALDENLRRALGSALRALEERVALLRKMQKQASERASPRSAADWDSRAAEYESEAEVIRTTIQRLDQTSAGRISSGPLAPNFANEGAAE